jgi:excisionase family DNA binding protein
MKLLLKGTTHMKESDDGFERLYTVEEAAKVTRMSVPWWRQAIFQKKVRICRIGRRVLIPDATIRDLLKTGIVEPVNGRHAGEVR